MKDNFFVTTPIYYVNDVPHIGHAYTSIACDVLARFKRLQGANVLFSTGTDEHGQKVEKAANEKKEKPIELADRVVERFKSLWTKLEITSNDFIRTTEPRHKEAVVELFQRIMEKGDIYKGFYEDWYCTPCESFWTEMQLADGNCPDCGRKTEKLKEESYFFRLSKYTEPLLAFYEKNPGFISPESRRNEIISFVKSGLKDLSISRTSFNWGIPVPGDEKHVIYVWFDALANYLTATGFPKDEKKFSLKWPCDVHVIGKDILRFHSVFWPAFLISAGLEPPKKIFAHGWWTVDGKKMSKSLMNAVEPNLLIKEFGADTIRYFLLREVPFGLDGDFSKAALIGRYNSDLANDLGNLFSRSLTMIIKYRNGKVPAVREDEQCELTDKCLCETAAKTFDEVTGFMDELSFSKALSSIWGLLNEVNRYIDKKAPWQLAKEGSSDDLDRTLNNIFRCLKLSAVILSPFIPESSAKMWSLLGLDGKVEEQGPISLASLWAIDENITVKKPEPLFPRIETMERKEENVSEKSSEEFITLDDFKKIKIKIATVTAAEIVPKSGKLLKLTVDDGDGERTIVAGIAKFYSPETLTGKRIAILANLKPARLMGIESNGMLLAASDGKDLAVLTIEKDIKNGSQVK